jgi:hypothetical protein
MIVNYIEVLDPTGTVEQKNMRASSGVGDLNGKVIGLVDNGKPNYNVFLARLEQSLCQRFKFAGIIHIRKAEMDTGGPLNAVDTEKLAANCNIVLNGICD